MADRRVQFRPAIIGQPCHRRRRKSRIQERSADLFVSRKTCFQRTVECSFVWVGDGELRAEMEGAARELGIFDRLTITGQIPRQEVSRWLHGMDVFVFPSRIEGFPLSA